VRIKSTLLAYNGDWIVESRVSDTLSSIYNITVTGAELSGGPRELIFEGNARGSATKLQHTYTDSDDVFIFLYIDSIAYADFTGLTENPWSTVAERHLLPWHSSVLSTQDGQSILGTSNPFLTETSVISFSTREHWWTLTGRFRSKSLTTR
jgi:hypothetical protein